MEPSKALFPVVDPTALNHFLAVAETGSMTRAARRLGLTQSAVSQSIARLENELGTALFDRANRPLALTAAGEALADGSGEYLSLGERLAEGVRAAAAEETPSLRIGLVDSFAATAGPALIRRLRRHAERITVWSGITPNLMADLSENRLDLMIASESRAPRGARRDPIVTEPFVIALPAGVAARTPEPRLADLARTLPLVRYSIRSHIGVQVENILKERGAEAPRSLEFDGTDAVLPMVAAGLGWAVTTPLCLVHGRDLVRNIAVAPIYSGHPSRTLHMTARRGGAMSARAAAEARAVTRELIEGPVRAMAPFAAERMIVHG
ncbi:MAG: LysR family transcriptional regulator [Magnetovibrio sp.]|nr:LysR family transcriptional regulator [Magnetovibrio sp.]